MNIPNLSALSRVNLEEIAKSVVFQRLVRKLDFEVLVAGIDAATEVKTFLENISRTRSTATYKTYTCELKKLTVYCCEVKTSLIEFTPMHADNYIIRLIAKGYSSASVALSVVAASSFCNFMERRHYDGVNIKFRNPFRGTRVKLKVRLTRPLVIPTAEEVRHIIKNLPPRQAIMVALMSGLGLTYGAFNTLVISGDKFSCYTKGKELSGTIPNDLLIFLTRNLKSKKLFGKMTVNTGCDRQDLI